MFKFLFIFITLSSSITAHAGTDTASDLCQAVGRQVVTATVGKGRVEFQYQDGNLYSFTVYSEDKNDNGDCWDQYDVTAQLSEMNTEADTCS